LLLTNGLDCILVGNSEATRRNGPIEEDGTFAGLWRREDPAPVEEDRTFGGLWRREDSAPVEEDRTFAGLWRRYVSKKA
jgi:hypothetical protein